MEGLQYPPRTPSNTGRLGIVDRQIGVYLGDLAVTANDNLKKNSVFNNLERQNQNSGDLGR